MTASGIRGWLRKRRPELRLGARVTAAGLASYVLALFANLPQGYWTVFTAILVTQASVGGSLKATFDRLIGTVGGALYGGVVVSVVPHTSPALTGLALALALAPLATLAAMNTQFRVAPVTAIILLLGSAGAQEGPVLAAALRTLEVTLGSIVGLVVSIFVLPARAHSVMAAAAARVLNLLAGLFTLLIERLREPSERAAVQNQHELIQSAFDKLESAAEEAQRERRTLPTEEIDPDPLPRTLRRIYHDIVLIGRVAAEPLPAQIGASLAPEFARLSETMASFLRGIGEALAQRRPPPAVEPVIAALGSLPALLRDVRPEPGEAGRLVALAFAFEQLQRNASDLAARAGEFARREKSDP